MKRLFGLLFSLLTASAALAQHASCSLSVPAIHLGTYAGTRVASGVTPVSVTCPAGSKYTVTLRSSATGSGNRLRTMDGPSGARLVYQMFQDAAHTLNWGSEVGTDAVSGIGNGSVQRFNIYPVIAPRQHGTQGDYSDNVTVSVTSNQGTFSTTVPVLASAAIVCFINSTNMAFANYSAALTKATSNITVLCVGAPFDIGISSGTTPGATTSNRMMAGPNGATLNYTLYRDAQYTLNWGDSIGIDTFAGPASLLSSQTIPVYGQIPAGQTPPSGFYSDTVIATITY